MGFFGTAAGFIGGAARKFGEFGKAGLSKFGAVKSSYNNLNNAFGGVIANSINSIPIVGPLLKSVGSYLDKETTFKQLEGVLDHARVYGKGLEALGNKLEHRRK